MESSLLENLRRYIVENNPELVINHQQGYSLALVLKDKIKSIQPMLKQLLDAGTPRYQIAEQCLDAMCADLKPSRANLIKEVLETEFPEEFYKFKEFGVLTYETVNLIEVCNPLFDLHGFNPENMENRFLRYALIAEIHDYLLGLSAFNGKSDGQSI